MQILHVYKTYFPEDITGIPRVIRALSGALADAGVESHVLTLADRGPGGSMIVDGQLVHYATRHLKIASADLSFNVLPRFRSLAAQADVVHYHFPWPAGELLHLIDGHQRPSVVTYHSDIVKQRMLRSIYAPFMHRFLSSVDCIVATSPNYLASSKVLQRYADRVSIIPIGLGPRMTVDEAIVADYKNQLGTGFFLFIGTARYYKGMSYLIEAARQTGLPVVLAGALARKLVASLPANVRALGPVSDAQKEALLSLSSALVLPSHLRSEAFGVVLLEAARAGKPLVTCEIGTGTTYVNLAGETGLVVPPGDPDALAAAMHSIAARPEAAQVLGKNAAQRFATHFTADEMGRRYLDVYRRATSRSERARAAN